jgi:hypothetical protein
VSRLFALPLPARGASSPRKRLAEAVRFAAAARHQRRLGAGVVAFADVREEQELLERLARLVEAGEPLDPPLAASVERIAAELAPPPLPEGLAQLRALAARAPAAPPRGRPRVHPAGVASLTRSLPCRRGRGRRGGGFVALRVARIGVRSDPDAAAGTRDDGAVTTQSAPTQGSSR